MTVPITSIQFRVLLALEGYLGLNGFSPTIRELCELTGTVSTNNMTGKLNSLERGGWIERESRRARTLTITTLGRGVLRQRQAGALKVAQ